MMTSTITPSFPTLIGRFQQADCTAVNAQLAAEIRARAAAEPSIQVANAGGWHSKPTLFDAPSPAMQTLRGWVAEAVNAMVSTTMELPEVHGRSAKLTGRFRLTAWGNIIRRGNYHRQHNHPGSAWSGVYYVESGGPSTGIAGTLELHDPRPFTEMTDVPGQPYGQRVLIRPTPGLMVLFPGFLYHFVHPFDGDGERISIAFNAQWLPG
jgi:uncharacterized protein (TIGR02466 family)